MLKKIKQMLGLIPYVSETDQLLASLNQRLPLSASQRVEIAKADNITMRRDGICPEATKNSLTEFLG